MVRPLRLAPVSVPLVLALAAAAGLALVSRSAAAPSPPKSDRPATEANVPAATGEKAAPETRALAELSYKKGYKDAQEAKKLKKAGKTAQATEKFAKALARFEEAVKIHEPYAEAWNMIGYCSRNVGDLRRAFDAYDRSLAIDPEYEEAHEYLGEAYVAAGNLEKAREQLAWLEAKKSDEAKELAEAIEAAMKEKPAAAPAVKADAAPASEAAPAPESAPVSESVPSAPPDSAAAR